MSLVVLLQIAALEGGIAQQDLILARKKHEIWVSERQSWQKRIALNEARFGEGVIAERDLIRARIEGGLLDLEVSKSAGELEAARAHLARLDASLPDDDFDTKLPPLEAESSNLELQAALSEYEAAREQVRTFHLRLLGASDESVAIEELLYEQSKTDLVTLLDAHRTRRSVRLRYVETLHQASVARLRVQHFLGRERKPT